jgi:hypothetical protein
VNTPDGVMLTEKDLGDIHSALDSAIGGRFVIAGGAVRDSLFGRPVKDIDVWLPADRLVSIHAVLHDMETRGAGTWRQVLPGFIAEYMSEGDILDICEVFLPAVPAPIQIITTSIPPESFTVGAVLERMDIELCRCALLDVGPSRKWAWALSPALEDFRNKTFTVRRMRTTEDGARTQRRIDRLSKKYEGFTAVWNVEAFDA